ncbi:MAG: hypothetical protein KF729_04280 [Sandaracinaceae bacterium]|nr:hypothetical protein [Sandaracinaceae bacterium]
MTRMTNHGEKERRASVSAAVLGISVLSGCSLLLGPEPTFRSDSDGGPSDSDGGGRVDGGDCPPRACENGGICVRDGADVRCECAGTGFDGPRCESPIVCRGAIAPTNGGVSAESAPYRDSVFYFCDAGFLLDGAESARCSADGEFDAPPPTCLRECPRLAAPHYGTVDRERAGAGQFARYECFEGFTLVGADQRVCGESGEWVGAAAHCTACTAEGWCWEHPLPFGNTLVSVQAFREDDVWVLGRGGLLIRWDGSAWHRTTVGRPQDRLLRLRGSAPSDLWAVGWDGDDIVGIALRWDGSLWSDTRFGDVAGRGSVGDIWSRGTGDAWAVRGSGVFRWNGSLWESQGNLSTPVSSVWGSTTAADVWVAGPRAIDRWDGGAWVSMRTGETEAWTIAGGDAHDLWVVENYGDVIHWDGVGWSSTVSGTRTFLSRVWLSADRQLWGATSAGDIVVWTGERWEVSRAGGTWAVGGTTGMDVWAVGNELAHWDGFAWNSAWSAARRGYGTYRGVWAFGPDDVWAVGGGDSEALVSHWDGDRWQETPVPPDVGWLYDVWGAGPRDLWAVGEGGVIIRWNGTEWTVSRRGGPLLWKLWGSGADDVWAVGDGGTVWRWNGVRWALVPTGVSSACRGVWGLGPDDVWIASSDVLLHWDGASIAPLSDAPGGDVVWGLAQDDIWVAFPGRAHHWDGSRWTEHAVPGDVAQGTARLTAVIGRASNEVWAMGDENLIRWDGSRWRREHADGVRFEAAAIDSDGGVWAVGGGRAILRRTR